MYTRAKVASLCILAWGILVFGCGQQAPPKQTTTYCGDGLIGRAEQCDGSNLNGHTCVTKGFAGGSLSCLPICLFDTSGCQTKPPDQNSQFVCGDGKADPGEDCDANDLRGRSCQSKGFSSGVLRCGAGCQLDLSGCTGASSAICGNGVIDVGEKCDGTHLNGQSCQTLGYIGGVLQCKACAFDVSGCTSKAVCGDGKVEAGEACDGPNLNGQSCQSLGLEQGVLRCVGCKLDASGCQKAAQGCLPACQAPMVCDPSTKTCVQCTTDADCNDGICLNQSCVGCAKDSDCASGACVSNQCVQCKTNAACTNASASKCAANRCVSCTGDADCSHLSGLTVCDGGTCVKNRKCEDWDNDRNAPCPNGTKNCDCSGGCGSATSCGSSSGAQSGCYTVQNTAVRSFEPAHLGGHGSGSFLWKPESESQGILVVLFPSSLPANKAWVETPNGTKEYSHRVVVSNPDRKTHYFKKAGKYYPNGSKACWSSQ